MKKQNRDMRFKDFKMFEELGGPVDKEGNPTSMMAIAAEREARKNQVLAQMENDPDLYDYITRLFDEAGGDFTELMCDIYETGHTSVRR